MKAKALLCIMVALPFTVFSQNIQEIEALWADKLAVFSKVSRQVEISYKKGVPVANAIESSEMMILNDNANGLFNKEKIYHSKFNDLKKVEAYTLVPEGSSSKKIKVTEFKTQSSSNRNIFYDDGKETSFDFPRIMKGSIAHVSTEHYQDDIRFLLPFYFSNHLPVHNSSFTISFPDDVEIKYIIKNDEKNLVTVKESLKGRKRKLEFVANNVNAYQNFGDGTSVPYHAPHVIVYVASYKNNNEKVQVFNTVGDLHKWSAGFLHNINSTTDENLKRITDNLCRNIKNPEDKAKSIFKWVQSNIKYVAFEDGLEGFIPRQAADVYTKRYGDCKDMASILTSMLKLSGLNAYFAWIGTRSIPYSYNEVPLPISDNHMICALQIEDKWIFLDATDPNCIFNFPTHAIQGKEALVSISPEKFELIKIPVVDAALNIITDSTFLTIRNNILVGKCDVDYSGYFGSDVYTSLLYNKGDDERVYARRRMAKGSNKFIMLDYKLNLYDSINKRALISSNFEVPDYISTIGNEIYLNLNLEKLFYTTLIDTSKRKIAIENDYLYTINQVHVLNIPAGYEVEYIPADVEVENDLTSFSIKYKKEKQQVIATQTYVQKKLYILPVEFPLINKSISIISPAYKEQVVLIKK